MLLLVGAAAPFLGLLDHPPEAVDGIRLLLVGQTMGKDWFEWVFLSNHWIGYRPLSVLTFAVADGLGGQPWLHRAMSIAAHLFALTMVFFAFRRFTRERGEFALLAVALGALHPATIAVAARLAERSYALSIGFGLGAVVALDGGRTRELRVATTMGAGLLLAVALLCNETAAVFLVLGPLALRMTPGRTSREIALHGAALAALALPVPMVARWLARGDVGGYTAGHYAEWVGDRFTRRIGGGVDVLDVVRESLQFLVMPAGPLGGERWVPLGVVGVTVAVAYYGWRVIRRPVSMQGWAVAWIASCTAIVAATATWFPRMSYAAGLATGVIVAGCLRDAWGSTERPVLRAAHLAPALLVLLTLILNGPAVNHAHLRPSPMMSLTRGLEGVQSEIHRPALVHLVLRQEPHNAQEIPNWLHHVGDEAEVQYRVAVYGGGPRGPVVDRIVPLRPRSKTGPFDRPRSIQRLAIDELPQERPHNYVFWLDGRTGVLHELQP